MKASILFCILLIVSISLFAQEDVHKPNFVNPSPTAASLGSYGNVNTNLATGTIHTSIPLFDLKVQSINFNISLEYS